MDALPLENAGQALLLIEHMLGYRPRNSLIAFALETTRDAAEGPGPMAQIDTNGRISPDFVDCCLDFIVDFHVKSLVLAWYVDDVSEFLAEEEQLAEFFEARAILDDCLSRKWGDSGFVAMFVTDYRLWFDDDVLATDHPASVLHRYRDLTESALGLELLYRGSVPTDQPPARAWPRDNRARRFKGTQSPTRPQALWLNRLNRFVLSDPPEPLSPSRALSDLGGASAVMKLNDSLSDIQFRDRLLASIVSSPQAQWTHFPDGNVEEMLARASTIQPRIDLLNRAIDLLSAIGSFSRSDDPNAYAIAAYLAWWLGDGKLARDNVNYALEADPNYSLAQLVEHALDVRLPPPWYRIGDRPQN